MRLHLAYLVSRYPSISHTFILREIHELRRLGFEIDVASINSPDRPQNKLTSQEREEAKRTLYVKQAGVATALSANIVTLLQNPGAYLRTLGFALRLGGFDARRIFYLLMYLVEATMVSQWMKARKASHLHVHFATPAATVGMLLTRLCPATLSITVHGPDEFYDVSGYYLSQKIASAKLICAISDYARSQLMRCSPNAEWEKIKLTRLGVDPEFFEPRPEPPRGETFEILCVGRLVPAKGQAVLLEALHYLLRTGRQVRLRYVGDGPDRHSLERRVKALALDRLVAFEGGVNQDRICEFYRSAHAFVLPSFAEGIPVVLMEAMAMQIPCVTTWVAGIPELIRDDVDGLLTPPGNSQILADRIASLIDDPELARRLGRAGRMRVLEHFKLSSSVEHLAAVFRTYLGECA